MITAHKTNLAKRISSETKLNIALEALRGKETIARISRNYNCSRTTVYKQQDKAIKATNKAFEKENEDVLFYIPVTKAFIHMMVVALFLICGSSYRNIIFFLENIFGYSLSLGGVFNIIDEACDKAIPINQSYDLSPIKTSAADELFHWNHPILAAVDIKSRFCALLAKADHRDYETWGIHLLDLEIQGYSPTTTIMDGAKGLVLGHQVALPKTRISHDHFHIIMDLKDCARFLKNKVDSSATETLKHYRCFENIKNPRKKKMHHKNFTTSLASTTQMEEIYRKFQLLSGWFQHDVLELAGHPPEERSVMYDFIVQEMEALAVIHPHRISKVITSLKNQKLALLDVTHALNEKFSRLAVKHEQPIGVIWAVCHATRYDIGSYQYGKKTAELEEILGKQHDCIEDDVLRILEDTHRCSSMVENFNSRLRPYLDERKLVTPKILALIQFFLNHRPFMRSQHKHLVNKTPAEAMTGKAHKPWFEMLGFSSFQPKAA